MVLLQISSWVARLAGLGALVLGLLLWIFQINLIHLHMLCGLLVVLSLLILGFAALSMRGGRIAGLISVIYALIVPIFGILQTRWFILDALWLIPTIHLLLGLGAIGLAQITFTRYLRLRKGTAPTSGKLQSSSERYA